MTKGTQAAKQQQQTQGIADTELAKRRRRFLEIASEKLGYSDDVAREAADRAVAASHETTNQSW
jgi:hypothetical protein